MCSLCGNGLSAWQYICGPGKNLRVLFLCSSIVCVCVKVEYVKASAKDLITHLHLDNGKYKEYGVGSS